VNLRAFFDEDFIYKALIISLSVHLFFVSSSLFIPAHHIKPRNIHKVEVTYAAVKKKEPEVVMPVPQPKPEESKPADKTPFQDSLNGSVFIKERNSAPDGLKVYERGPDKNRVFNTAIKKSVSIPLLESEKINNPSYQNYYSLVRSRIKQRAYFNYAEYYAGEVYLTFVLYSDGTLKDLKIIEERSSGGPYLRTIGLKSIKEATPFPPFPKTLKYPELTFNVVISFQVHDQ
jgi:outer membrane biosynthesis protein TonB